MAVWPPSAEDLMKSNKQLQEENRHFRETLRDKFAMAALQGLFAHSGSAFSFENYDYDDYVKDAYTVADTMLEERER